MVRLIFISFCLYSCSLPTEHLVQYVTAMVKVHPDDAYVSGVSEAALQAGKKPKSPAGSKTIATGDKPLPQLYDFIENISIRSRCTMSTMLVALIYLDRLQKILMLKQPTSPSRSYFFLRSIN
jgi:hypothetical protein